VIGTRLVELLEHPVRTQEEHLMGDPTGRVAERASEEGFPYAGGTPFTLLTDRLWRSSLTRTTRSRVEKSRLSSTVRETSRSQKW
jgi:hypothetical protein